MEDNRPSAFLALSALFLILSRKLSRESSRNPSRLVAFRLKGTNQPSTLTPAPPLSFQRFRFLQKMIASVLPISKVAALFLPHRTALAAALSSQVVTS